MNGSLLAASNCVLPSAPVGALIGKIGGSSAGLSDGTLFVMGKFALVEIDKSKGPAISQSTMNLRGLRTTGGEINVKVSSRPVAAAAVSGAAAPVASKTAS